ncbi:hypothetical protein KY338_01940 [Candidatus Woesearchaeota archaeon]|nr:hypothetical protein [Candidatus Woesearchaeota archaeon]MBW3005962.1 hypothetical protein [Candidatus Woesearchaeota archaeon]
MNISNVLVLLSVAVDHVKIIASNKKQLEDRIKKQQQGIGFLMAILLLVGLIALASMLWMF